MRLTKRALLLAGVWLALGCGDSSSDPPADAGKPPRALALGDVIDLADTGEALAAEIVTATGAERYLLVLHSPVWTGDGPVAYGVTAAPGAADAAALAATTARRVLPPPGTSAVCPPARPSPAHLADLPWLVEALRRGRARPAWRAEAPPAVGEVRSFSVLGDDRVARIDARAVYVSPTVAIWLDVTSEPPAAIDPATLADIAAGYEDVVLPREHLFFGEESDVNGDGIVFVLMSAVVNEHNGPLAYFYPCDLMEPDTPGCRYSNEAELIYLTPPNALEYPYNTSPGLLETMAHETNHMIFFNTKYLAHGTADDIDNLYLLEGLAALAQDLTGYQVGNLYVAWYGLETVLELSISDILQDYLGYDTYLDGCYRGGAYLLMRYLYDQAGGDHARADGTFGDRGGIAFLRELCNSRQTGLANLVGRLDRPLDEAVLDFFTALAVTNRGPGHGPLSADPRFSYLPVETDPLTGYQRGFDAFADVSGGSMTGPTTVPYPYADGEMVPSGVEYLVIDATEAGGRLTVHVTSPPAWRLRARLARIE